MRVNDHLDRLQSLTDQFPEWQRPIFAPPASPEAIRELERAAGAALPADLWEFFQRHDEVRAMDVHNGYWLGGTEVLIRCVTRGDFPMMVESGDNPTAVVPIATDGGGNAFLASLGDGGVWRWMHETCDTTRVAPSFTQFLERVADDWEHAASDDAEWSFLV